MTLAVTSYETLPVIPAGREALDLSWTADERAYLDIDLDTLVARELGDEQCDRCFASSYLVRDPYGEGVLGAEVARFFGRPGWDCGVVCGAGVNGLLHALAGLAAGRTAHVVGRVYPDFPHWVARAGGTTRACPGSDAARHAAAARAANATVVFVERPSPFEDGASLEALRTLCEGVADVGALVLVDESYGNYLPPRLSAVHLALEVTNLVVLRGLSKAYSLGGLRLGYAVASHPAAARVRAAVPPLGVASLSLRIGRAVLARGDMAGRLRARVSTARAEAAALLDGSGMVELLPSCDALPLLLCRGDAADVQGRLAERGVISKRQPFWCSESGALRHVCRLSVPLEPERIAALRRLLRA